MQLLFFVVTWKSAIYFNRKLVATLGGFGL